MIVEEGIIEVDLAIEGNELKVLQHAHKLIGGRNFNGKMANSSYDLFYFLHFHTLLFKKSNSHTNNRPHIKTRGLCSFSFSITKSFCSYDTSSSSADCCIIWMNTYLGWWLFIRWASWIWNIFSNTKLAMLQVPKGSTLRKRRSTVPLNSWIHWCLASRN